MGAHEVGGSQTECEVSTLTRHSLMSRALVWWGISTFARVAMCWLYIGYAKIVYPYYDQSMSRYSLGLVHSLCGVD